MRPCVFCGSTEGRGTDEHVIPKWARDAFGIEDWVTTNAVEAPGRERMQAGRMRHLNVVLKDGLCRPCNTDWLAPIEDRVKPILLPMMLGERAVVLDAPAQALLSFWAVKTGLLLEMAIRQRFPGKREVEGYRATTQELAWLRHKEEPPPRSMVWLECWDCAKEIPVNYEPSGADLPNASGARVTGHLTTFTLGFVAFQLFTVDFIAAEVHDAEVWNTRPPERLRDALTRIWPPQLTVADVQWPQAMFARTDWHSLVTWDGELRRPPRLGA